MDPNYISKTHSITTAIVLTAVPLLYIVVKKVLHRLSAPIRQLPGPKSVNWLTGSLERHVWEPDAQDTQLEWTQKYGPVFKYYGMFNVSVPYVSDSNQIRVFYISRRPLSLLRISKRWTISLMPLNSTRLMQTVSPWDNSPEKVGPISLVTAASKMMPSS